MAYYFNKFKEQATSSIQQIAKNIIIQQEEEEDNNNMEEEQLDQAQQENKSENNNAQDDFFNTFIPSIQKSIQPAKSTNESKTPISKSNTMIEKNQGQPFNKKSVSAQRNNETEELEERIKAY